MEVEQVVMEVEQVKVEVGQVRVDVGQVRVELVAVVDDGEKILMALKKKKS